MFCSTIHAIIIYATFGAKHVAKVWRTRRSSLACLSKISSSPVKSQAYHSDNDDYERIRKWHKSRNDKCYSKVDANPHHCFNHIPFCIIVHFYKSTPYDNGYWYYFKVICTVNSLIASVEDNYQYICIWKLPNGIEECGLRRSSDVDIYMLNANLVIL